ncbi:MAG: hypothetical protein ACKO2K_16145, partial [Alphaproteobacteria bacterium]
MAFPAHPRRDTGGRRRQVVRALVVAAGLAAEVAACTRDDAGPASPGSPQAPAGARDASTADGPRGADSLAVSARRTLRRGIHPLVGFRSEDPLRFETRGRVVARWVELEDGLHRAIEMEPGASLAVRVDPDPGAVVRAGLAVRPPAGAVAPQGHADFRVRLASAPGEPGTLLAEPEVEVDGR